MLILLVMPLALVLLFGYALSNETKGTRLAFVDGAHDDMAQSIRQHFADNLYFEVCCDVPSESSLMKLFDNGDIDAAVVIPEGFSTEAVHSGDVSVQIIVDGSEPNQASVRLAYAQQILMSCVNEVSPLSAPIEVDSRILYNPQSKSEYNYVPAVIGLILMLICAMMTSIAIVREKEMGTMEILLASPLSPSVIIISKLIPYFVVSSANLVTILLVARYLMGVPMAGSLLLFSIITLVYIIVALSFGLLISSLVNSQLAAMLLSLLLIVPSVYLSGLAFPIESMPVVAQRISVIIPPRWYVDAARKIMIQGVDFYYVAKDLAILCLMAIVLIIMSVRLFKTRLE